MPYRRLEQQPPAPHGNTTKHNRHQALACWVEQLLPFGVMMLIVFLSRHCVALLLCVLAACALARSNATQRAAAARGAVDARELAAAAAAAALHAAAALWLAGAGPSLRALIVGGASGGVSVGDGGGAAAAQSGFVETLLRVAVVDSLARLLLAPARLLLEARGCVRWRQPAQSGGSAGGEARAASAGGELRAARGGCRSRKARARLARASDASTSSASSGTSSGSATPVSPRGSLDGGADNCGDAFPAPAAAAAPPAAAPRRQRVRHLALLAALEAAYRAALPLRPWCAFLRASTPSPALNALLAAAYLALKAADLWQRAQELGAAARRALPGAGPLYGRYCRDDRGRGREPAGAGDLEGGRGGKEPPQCPICHEACVAAVALHCGHIYCEGCIDHWIERASCSDGRCPLCRARVVPAGAAPAAAGSGDGTASLLPQLF